MEPQAGVQNLFSPLSELQLDSCYTYTATNHFILQFM